MANTKKYVSLDKLGLYDEKIKDVISAGDAAALKSAKDYADSLASNYDAAGSAAGALESAKAYADGKDAAIAEAKKTGTDAAAAAKTADDKAVAAQREVDALELYVGTIPEGATATDVVGYVIEKTTGIASEGAMTELGNRVTTVEGKVANIEKDYLKAADKTELEGKINGVQTAVDTEKGRAEGEEAKLAGRIKAIEDDYLKAADKEALEGQIETVANAVEVLTDGVDAEKVDGVKDLIKYVEEHGTEVTGMKGDISKNAEDIAGVAGRMTTAEGKITAVEGAVATKAEKTYVDEQVQALQGVDSGLDTRLKAVEAKFGEGEGNVESQIATAKQEAIDAAAADAKTKADAAEAAAKTHANGLNSAMNTRVEALEAIDHSHDNKAELDLIASGDKAKWDEAYAKRHEHSNLTVLEGITAAKVSAWDAAEGNAKTHADGLNTAMNTRVAALETWHTNFVECSQEDIQALFA